LPIVGRSSDRAQLMKCFASDGSFDANASGVICYDNVDVVSLE